MQLTRIGTVLGAAALGGVLVASTYGAQAAKAPDPHAARLQAQVQTGGTGRFVPPAPHRYRADGLRMGLHCETSSMAMP